MISKFELNRKGVAELMKSDGMQSVLNDHASAIRNRCGNGYEQDIYVGKNNRQNDILTLKTANREDYFFHAKDIPGSHVILRNNELNEEDAKSLIKNGCFCLTEGANMPCLPAAVEVFMNAKILFAPGKAANAGGVATSGLEMTQNSMRLSWDREEVDARLHVIMKNIHEACYQNGKQADGYINYVKGANIAGFLKVATAMCDQGLI